MEIQKRQKKIRPSPTINYIINNNHHLLQYFQGYCEEQDYGKLAIQLMQQAIKARKEQSAHKHYNVAYIKHNRFLSPSQKHSVTAKITEMIPISPEKIIIFGKPKVRLGDGQFCVEHGRRQPQVIEKDSVDQNHKKSSPKNSKDQSDIQRGLIQNDKMEQQVQKQKKQDSQIYLSPKAGKVKQNNPKPFQNQKIKKGCASKKQYSKSTKNLLGEQNFKSNKGINKIESNQKQMKSPHPKLHSPHENYDNVESKIKFLIERDKRNKKLQNQFEQQKRKLEKLEERQEQLLLKQYKQGKEIEKQNIPVKNSQICCSCSSDQEINDKLIGLRERLSRNDVNFSDKINKLKDKTYKISSQPIYPITSSSSSQNDLQMEDESSDF